MSNGRKTDLRHCTVHGGFPYFVTILTFNLHHWKNISQYVTSWMHSWGECSSHMTHWLHGGKCSAVQYLYSRSSCLKSSSGFGRSPRSYLQHLIQHCWPWNRRRCIAPSGSCYFAHLGKRLSQAVPWTLTSRCQDTITMALTPCEERVIPEANHAVSQHNDFVYFSFSVFECWVVILTVSLVKGLW